jgi:hypothetical protein
MNARICLPLLPVMLWSGASPSIESQHASYASASAVTRSVSHVLYAILPGYRLPIARIIVP